MPPFCYTVGLFGIGHPELLVLGLNMDNAAGVLNHLADQVYDGRQLMHGEVVSARARRRAESGQGWSDVVPVRGA